MSSLRELVLPWLLVLPAFVLASAFSPLADDPYPHLAGSGLAALALIPAALVLLARGAHLGSGWTFFWTAAFALCVARPLAPVTDTLEARRALLVLACAPLAFAAGAALSAAGRVQLACALVLFSSASLVPSVVAGFEDPSALAGLLGDTGSLSQAALPGAAVGATWLALRPPAVGRGLRALGALALAAFLLHAGLSPVIAGAHSLLAALGLAAWRARQARRALLAALALTALLAPMLGIAAARAGSSTDPKAEVAQAPSGPPAASGDFAGLGVRGRVWTAALGLLAAHPLLGVGPGQFQAAFPAVRDPREIELSRHGPCSELDTEVEHAHNDWLQYFFELGLPGGALFVLGLAWAARAAWRGLCGDSLPLAAAALALLVNSAVHAPLSANPASAPLAFALFGALAWEGDRPSSRPPSRAVALAAVLPLALALSAAPGLVAHGSRLARYVRAARRIEELAARTDGDAATAALVAESAHARALLLAASAAQPESAPLLALWARVAQPEQRAAAWDALLRVRPHAVEAWEQSATDQAELGNPAEARARYARARALSPTHPRIQRNQARLELTLGDLALGLATLEALRAQGCLDPAWPLALGRELVLVHGSPARGARLLFAKDLAQLVPEELHAAAQAEPRGSVAADALECLAQLLWARANVEAGRADIALRNYRQANDRSRAQHPGGAAPYLLEWAAAEARAGHADEARARLAAARPGENARRELPAWALETLESLDAESRRGQ